MPSKGGVILLRLLKKYKNVDEYIFIKQLFKCVIQTVFTTESDADADAARTGQR